MGKKFLTMLLTMLMVMFSMPAIALAEDADVADPVVVKTEDPAEAKTEDTAVVKTEDAEEAEPEKTDGSADVSDSSDENTVVKEEAGDEPVQEWTHAAVNAKDV